MKFLIMQFVQHLVTSSLRSVYFPLHPDLEHLQPMFYFEVRDQVSHPHKIRCKIILILTFLDKNWKNKSF
jgi:hypothetical protein